MASTLFGASTNGCNQCHSGGTAPDVGLTSSAATLTAGQQITLTFTVTTVNGNPGAAGFNLRSDKAGTFAVGGTGSAGTQVVTGTNGFSEATHTTPRAGEPATFTTLWTPGAGTTGAVMFTAWGNAVNLSGNNSGDRAASAMLTVNVTCTSSTFYPDGDGDGFGAMTGAMSACTAPPGYVTSNTDCNDASAAVHPGAAETCNGVDDNCSGGVDEGIATAVYFRDADGDGFGAMAGASTPVCAQPAGFVPSNTDCNDSNAAVHPGATEICNGVDDNCSGAADEGMPMITCGMGVCRRSVDRCVGGIAQDCVPGTPGPELCNGMDDNCNGMTDEGEVCIVDAGSDALDASDADSGGATDGVADATVVDASDATVSDVRDAAVSEVGDATATDAPRIDADGGASLDLDRDGASTDVRVDASTITDLGLAEIPPRSDGAADMKAGDAADAGRISVLAPGTGGGCSCNVAAPAAPGDLLLWLAALGLILRARRRR